MVAHLAMQWLRSDPWLATTDRPYALLAAVTAERLAGQDLSNPTTMEVLIKVCLEYRMFATIHPTDLQFRLANTESGKTPITGAPGLNEVRNRVLALNGQILATWLSDPTLGPGERFGEGLKWLTMVDAYAVVYEASLSKKSCPESWQEEVLGVLHEALQHAEQFFATPHGFLRSHGEAHFRSVLDASIAIDAIRSVLRRGDVAIARELTTWAVVRFPDNATIERLAAVLSPPTASVTASNAGGELQSSQRWLRENENAYAGKWVVVDQGVLVRAGSSFSDVAAGGIPEGSLVTRVL